MSGRQRQEQLGEGAASESEYAALFAFDALQGRRAALASGRTRKRLFGGRRRAAASLVALALAGGCILDNPGFDEPGASGVMSASEATSASVSSASGSTSTGVSASGTTAPPTTTLQETSGEATTGNMTATTTTTATTSSSTTDELHTTGFDGETITLRASKSYDPSAWHDASVDLDGLKTFALPTSLPVIVGNAGNHSATLTYEGEGVVTCTYTGGSAQSKPEPQSTEWDNGLSYVQKQAVLCDNGANAGDVVDATWLGLSIDNGHSGVPEGGPQTTVEVQIPIL